MACDAARHQTSSRVSENQDEGGVIRKGERDMEVRERGGAYLGSGEGRRLRVLGEMVTYKVTAVQTGGAYSLFEVSTPPGGGPPPHIQHREDECVFILEGEYEFVIGGTPRKAGVGTLVYVPRGTVHAFSNSGTGTGRLLLSHTPGGSHERFFEEIGEEEAPSTVAGGQDISRVMRVAAGYGIEILPPRT